MPQGVIVDLMELLDSVLASLVAAIALILIFSLAIWGATKFVDLSREGRTVAAVSAITVGGTSLVATIALIVAGLYVMVS